MAVDRPEFDQAPHGYDRRQVDAYVAGLWRYASALTARAAEAEAALARERANSRTSAQADSTAGDEAAAGERIGRIIQLAGEEAEAIRAAARAMAQTALGDAVERAAEGSPVVREAREQADRLLMDAQEEANRHSRRREEQADARVAHASAEVEELRRRQVEVLGGLQRLRELLGDRALDRALAGLAGAGRREGEVPGWPGGPGGAYRAGPRDIEDAEVIDAELVEDDDPGVCR